MDNWVKNWGSNLKIREVPVPAIASDEALVRVDWCGVGGTTSNFMKGLLASGAGILPRIPGHEVTGTVEKVGKDVRDFSPGDKVAVYFYLFCGRCFQCLAGRENLCENFAGFVGIHTDGGYAEMIKVPSRNLFRLPGSLDMRSSTVISDAVGTPYHIARERAKIVEGEHVAIIGAAGGVGIHMVQMAKLFRSVVTGVDIGHDRLTVVSTAGAEFTADASEKGWENNIFEFTGGKGADVVIDFVGSEGSVHSGISILSRRGRFVEMAMLPEQRIVVENRKVILSELSIMGSRYCTRQDIAESIKLVNDGKIKPIISEECELEAVENLHERIDERRIVGRGVVKLH
ncbi:MAG: alcohol dehydrogenase catalytic domain-containing protein [Methanomassiliicoccales archaeon]|nr:alcohol dehydrogenase catalytic domain-containing protein [Methanomassiliicoccales archaeon]